MAESSSLSQNRGNKTSPCCLDGWIIYSNGIGNMQAHVLLINQKCCFKLDLQWNPNDFDCNFGVLVCILMPNSM
jgi:hypothetical protein